MVAHKIESVRTHLDALRQKFYKYDMVSMTVKAGKLMVLTFAKDEAQTVTHRLDVTVEVGFRTEQKFPPKICDQLSRKCCNFEVLDRI